MRKVGDIVEYNGVKLKAAIAPIKSSCSGCYINGSILDCSEYKCMSYGKDKMTSVIFVEVELEED